MFIINKNNISQFKVNPESRVLTIKDNSLDLLNNKIIKIIDESLEELRIESTLIEEVIISAKSLSKLSLEKNSIKTLTVQNHNLDSIQISCHSLSKLSIALKKIIAVDINSSSLQTLILKKSDQKEVELNFDTPFLKQFHVPENSITYSPSTIKTLERIAKDKINYKEKSIFLKI